MLDEQLAFNALLADADERARKIRDDHLGRVQQFFDDLSEPNKLRLAHYMTEAEYDTCLALSVAACDWFRARTGTGAYQKCRASSPLS